METPPQLHASLAATLASWPRAALAGPGLVLLVGAPQLPTQGLWPHAVVQHLNAENLTRLPARADRLVWLHPALTDLSTIPGLLKPQGLALLATPRPWPLGLPGSAWASGLSLKNWQAELKPHGLKMVAHTPVGGPAGCARWLAVGLAGRGGKGIPAAPAAAPLPSTLCPA